MDTIKEKIDVELVKKTLGGWMSGLLNLNEAAPAV